MQLFSESLSFKAHPKFYFYSKKITRSQQTAFRACVCLAVRVLFHFFVSKFQFW